MGANNEYIIKVSLDGDSSGLEPLEKELKNLEDKAGKLDGKSIGIKANVGGTALSTLDAISSKLSKLKDTPINITVSGSAETSLKNIEGHLEKIAHSVETKVEVGGKAEKDLESIQDLADKLGKPIGIDIDVDDSDITALTKSIIELNGISLGVGTGLAEGLASAFDAVNTQLSSISRSMRELSVTNDMGFDNITKSIQGATSELGNFQRAANSITMPDITMSMPEMGGYYGGFDSMGNFNLGAIGGSRLFSTLGLGTVKSLTWGNASMDNTNAALLGKITDTPEKIMAKTYEGGGYDISHAVTQGRLIRRTNLIPSLYSFSIASGADADTLLGNVFGEADDPVYGRGSGVDVIAAFGEMVQLQTGSEQLANTAMFDLSKGFKGQLNSIDQYGISRATLKEHGYNVDKDDDLGEYLRAVGEIIGANEPNDMIENTISGGMSTLRKRFYNSGQKIGNMFLEPVGDLANLFNRIDAQDWDFAGLTIPKGTISQLIIVLTGLTSSIGPLKYTLKELGGTFNNIKTTIHDATLGLERFADRIVNVGNASKIKAFHEQGAYGILNSEKIARDNKAKLLDLEIERIQGEKGVHNFSFDDIDNSSMTWDQRRRTKNSMKLDDKLFDLEGGVPKNVKNRLGLQADKYKQEMSRAWLEEARGKGLSGTDARKYVNSKRDDYQKELLDDYITGRKNEISRMSNFGKLKMGFKDSFTPQISAFNEAFKKEKDKYKDTAGGFKGFFKQIKGKSIGNLKGLKSGISSFFSVGGFKNSISSFGGILGGLIGAINPVTLALYGLMAGIMALGGIFLIAYSNSEKFRAKLAEFTNKLHELFDTLAYTIGDMLQASGLSEHGGAEGVSEFATKIMDALVSIVEVVQEILLAMGGRDLTQSKKTSELQKKFEDTYNAIQAEEKEKGVGKAKDKLYQNLVNYADQLKMYDPTFWTDDRIHEYGLDDEKYTDREGVTLASFLQEDNPEDTYNYLKENQLKQLEYAGIEGIDYKDLESALKTDGKWDPEKLKQFNTALQEQKQYDTTGWIGKKWNESEFVKSNPALNKEMDPERENRSHGVWDIIGSVVWWLEKIGWITAAILAAITADKILGFVNDLKGLKGSGGWGEAIKKVLNERYSNLKLGDKLEGVFGKAKESASTIWDKIKNRGGTPKKPGANTPELPPKRVEGDFEIVDADEVLKSKNKAPDIDDVIDITDYTKTPADTSELSRLDKLKGFFEKIKKDGLGSVIKDSERLSSIIEKISTKMPNLTKFLKSSNILGKIGSTLSGGLGKLIGGAGGKLGGILAKLIGGGLGKGFLAAIPIVGEIIMALWTAWDLTSMICDFLHGLGVPEWLMEAIFPLRVIQNRWDEIWSTVCSIGSWIWGFLSSIGGTISGIFSTLFDILNPIFLIVTHFDTLKQILGEIWSKFFNIGDTIDGIRTTIENALTNPLQTVLDIIKGIIGFVIDPFGTVSNALFGGGNEGTNASPNENNTSDSQGNILTDAYQKLTSFANTNSSDQPLTQNTGTKLETTQKELINTNSSLGSSIGTSNTVASSVATDIGQSIPTESTPIFGTNSMSSTMSQNMGLTNGMPMAPISPTTNQYSQENQNGQAVINNNVTINGSGETSETLAKLVVKTINEKFLWDVQKAGRTIDGGRGII